MDNNLFASVGFSAYSLFFALFILIMYFNKKRFKNIENSLFLTLLLLVIYIIFLEFGYVYYLYHDTNLKAALFLCRMWLDGIIVWMSFFTYYILVLRTRSIKDINRKKSIRRKLAYIFLGVTLLSLIAANILPIKLYDYTNHIYSFSGDATNIGFMTAAITIGTIIYAFVFRKDLLNSNQRKPVMFAIIVIITITAIQLINDKYDLNYQNFEFVLLLMTLYFTIESQDNKLLAEHEKSKEEAEKANREQTEFLTSMSHEIRTPMSVIMGYSDAIIREKNLTKDIVNSDTENIHTAAVNLLELINNILDLSRMESGKEQVIEKEYDTQNLLVEINDLVLSKIDKENIRYSIVVDQNLPKKLQGDYTKASRVLSNTIINVLHYVKKGGLTFKVGLTKRDNSFLLLATVESENSEIDEEEYNLYYSNESREVNKVNNVFLGMTVAKMYAEMLHGRVIMTNKDRYNISYYIEIEQNVVDPNPVGDISSLFIESDENTKINLEGKNVLVVDDNMLNLKLIKRLLVDYNINVEMAKSGLECIDKVKEANYDAIFLDHMMPGMDGIETLNELRNIKSGLPPIIALTANSYSGVKDTYINAGFTDYLAKPINKNELNRLLINIFKS